MVTHIVFFTFKQDNREANIIEAKKRIESMVGQVPSLVELSVGLNFADEERAMDMALVTHFDDRDGLAEYATHPVHLEVIEFIKRVVEYTKVVDYEI